MKKILTALVILSTLGLAKIDVVEATSMNVYEMTVGGKVSIQKVCVDGKLFVAVISSTGVSITQVLEFSYSHKVLEETECGNGN